MFDLIDSYQRKFEYLRLSVTDRCNFRCVYCLPDGYKAPAEAEPELSSQEIRRLIAAFARLGVWKVRLTGGEPTVRRDIVELVELVASVPGIRKVAITTNGNRLAELAAPLKGAGITSVNVSIDSLDRDKFKTITGTARFDQVLEGVERALAAGIESVKVNAVLLRDFNHSELGRFMDWVRDQPVSVRFIELMRTGRNGDFFDRHHLSGGAVQFELVKSGWVAEPRRAGDGPAVVYRHPGYRGSIGIIAPYSPDFCKGCNRLRVSSRGALRLCLFGEKDASLRDLLGDDASLPELVERVRGLVIDKPVSHFLHEGKYGNTWNLAAIGG